MGPFYHIQDMATNEDHYDTSFRGVKRNTVLARAGQGTRKQFQELQCHFAVSMARFDAIKNTETRNPRNSNLVSILDSIGLYFGPNYFQELHRTSVFILDRAFCFSQFAFPMDTERR